VTGHAKKADKLLIKPTAGARPAPPCTPGRFIPKAHKTRPDARRVTSDTDDTTLATAPDGPTQRLSQTPERRYRGRVLSPRKVRGSDVLIRFWITIEEGSEVPAGSSSPLGFGVTAFDREDAIGLLRADVFGGQLPTIESIIEGVDVSTLDEGHIRPNMETPAFRGVWYPKGFARSSR
jgi:hypothetical protein